MASPHRWVVLAVAVTAFCQTHLHRLGYAPLIPTFVADLGLSYAAAGTIQTAYFWTYTLMQVPIGVAADRVGVRRVMVACMALLAVGAVLFSASTSFAAAVLARMLVGLGASAVWVPCMRLISEWFPPGERARATGIVSAGGGAGGTLGLLLVPWLAARWGWRAAYRATAVPAALTAALLAVAVRPGPARPAAPAAAGVADLLRQPALWPVNLTVFFAYGAYFSLLTFLPAFLVSALGAREPVAGLVTGLVTAGTTISWPLAGWLSDRQGRRRPLTLLGQLATVLACLAFALVVPGQGLAAAVVTAAVTGLLAGGMILPFVTVVELVDRDRTATAAGITNAACFVGAMVLPILLGRIVDVTGGFAGAFLVAAALEALALGCALAIRETGEGRAGRRPMR